MMREFQLSRYIRKWWWLIAVLSVMSGVIFFYIVSSNQTYKASMMLEFTNADAKKGIYPSGDSIDVQEIKSSAVIWNALESLGRSDSVDSVRRRTSVSAVISDEDSARQAAQWAKGNSYSFFPTQYIVSYESAKNESASSARQVVEAIVDSFINLFSTKYMAVSQVPNSVESLQNLNYDYIEWAEVIDSFVTSDINYLKQIIDSGINFRSSSSGYSFQDLYNEYNLINTVYLPSLYSTILENHVTTDSELLISRYQYRKNQNNLAIQNYKEALAVAESMLKNYEKKNEETMLYHWGSDTTDTGFLQSSGNNYVVRSVLSTDEYATTSTDENVNTYDNVLNRYITLRTEIAQREADNEYCDYVFSAFSTANTKQKLSVDNAHVLQVEELISFIEGRLRALDKLMNMTASEDIQIEAMKSIKVRSTVYVKETVNVRLYTVLIVIVFFIIGVAIAVVLGRSLDFVEYHFYTDSATGLPNRMKCDNEIKQYGNKMLPVPFSVIVISLTNMNDINAVVGRDAGNEVLRVFATHIQDSAEQFGFVGYNGSLTFLGLFPSCDVARSTFFRNILMRSVADFNRGEHGVVIRYKIATSTATENSPRTIRELVSMAMAQLRIENVVVAEEGNAPTITDGE